MTLATVTASVFTAAGLATISNQLLADSNPAVDGLVTADLAKRLVALEEAAFINGTGTGQPLGILNTPGIGATALTATDVTVAARRDPRRHRCNGRDEPRRAVRHPDAPAHLDSHPQVPRRAGRVLHRPGRRRAGPAHGPARPGQVPLGLPGRHQPTACRPTSARHQRVPRHRRRLPEALILDRQGITVDESSHVYFTTNQTVFRAEERVGFTAARTPLAFNVVGGRGPGQRL
jgi:hypothetical protein